MATAPAYVIANKTSGQFLALGVAGPWVWVGVAEEALQFARERDANAVAARFIVNNYEIKEWA